MWPLSRIPALRGIRAFMHIIFEPLDFIARLAALVPKPHINLTRFHGVFAPNRKHRARVMLAKRGEGNKTNASNAIEDPTPAAHRASMTWAQRLKRVCNIDIETCRKCAGSVRLIAAIEDPVVIKKKLTPLKEKAASAQPIPLPESRAPPQSGPVRLTLGKPIPQRTWRRP